MLDTTNAAEALQQVPFKDVTEPLGARGTAVCRRKTEDALQALTTTSQAAGLGLGFQWRAL